MVVYLPPQSRNQYDSKVAKTIQNRGDLVAQLVEHLPFKEVVLGSSPSQVTKAENNTTVVFGFFYGNN